MSEENSLLKTIEDVICFETENPHLKAMCQWYLEQRAELEDVNKKVRINPLGYIPRFNIRDDDMAQSTA